MVWDTRRHELEPQTIEQYYVFEELDDDGLVVLRRYNRMTLCYACQ